MARSQKELARRQKGMRLYGGQTIAGKVLEAGIDVERLADGFLIHRLGLNRRLGRFVGASFMVPCPPFGRRPFPRGLGLNRRW